MMLRDLDGTLTGTPGNLLLLMCPIIMMEWTVKPIQNGTWQYAMANLLGYDILIYNGQSDRHKFKLLPIDTFVHLKLCLYF